MSGSKKIIGELRFLVQSIENEEGYPEYRQKIEIGNIPPEAIIMQMKSLIKHLEKSYFNQFLEGLGKDW